MCMSLDRDAVVRRYKQLCVEMGLDYKDVILSAGAAMVLMGVRKHTQEIDVDVPAAFFNQQRVRKGFTNGLLGEAVAWDGMVDIHPLPAHFTDGDVMNYLGIWIYSPKALMKQKRKLAKHKDREPRKAAQDRCDLVKLKEIMDNVNDAKRQLENAGVSLVATKV